ncbi:hypothetical protein B0H21DRAFT_754983 [Amylocystis lapponica]|nr:hypothetical protein B0H21DRAFT_754983 [Amylocystis lapponica]
MDGRGVVHEGGYRTPEDVLHFRIDEEQKTLLTVSRSGGMLVRALEDNRVLWGLGKDHVFRSRCELSHGFLLFTSKHAGLEVWRRSTDAALQGGPGSLIQTPICEPSSAAALDFQFSAAHAAAVLYPPQQPHDSDISERLRGQYVPHAYLGKPFVHIVRIYRLRFPVLALLSAQERDAVLLFDVRDGTVLRRVSFNFDTGRVLGAPNGFQLPAISDRVVMDIDVTRTHILICLHSAIIVVPWRKYPGHPPATHDELHARDAREEPPPLLVLGETDVPQVLKDTAMQLSRVFTRHTPTVGARPLPDTRGEDVLFVPVDGRDSLEEFAVVPPPEDPSTAPSHALVQSGTSRVPPCFVSAQFSPDGRHFAAVTVFGLLYLVADYVRVERRATTFAEATKRVYMGEWLRDLSWGEHQTRLVVQTASEELFLVNTDTALHAARHASVGAAPDPGAAPAVFPHLAVFHFADFSDPHIGWTRERGAAFSGVQMTRTAIWVVWDLVLLRRALREREQRRRKGHILPPRYSEEDEQPGAETGCISFVSFAPMV